MQKIFKVTYQHEWMKEINPSYTKSMFIHAESEKDIVESVFKSMMFPKTTFKIEVSTLIEEIKSILNEDLSCDIFYESVEGIDDELAQKIIKLVREFSE